MFPAYAGVIPVNRFQLLEEWSVPCVCEGDPRVLFGTNAEILCSPHAGVILKKFYLESMRDSVPRVCGGTSLSECRTICPNRCSMRIQVYLLSVNIFYFSSQVYFSLSIYINQPLQYAHISFFDNILSII